jgi:hypothetical protein
MSPAETVYRLSQPRECHRISHTDVALKRERIEQPSETNHIHVVGQAEEAIELPEESVALLTLL